MASLRKRGRVWYYRYVDADGVQHERKGCPDRRETEAMAASLESEASKVKAGIVDTRDLAFRDADRKALAEHLADWRSAMIAKGRTLPHANLSHNRAAKVAALAKADRLSRLGPAAIQAALSTLKDGGASLQTLNHHRAALRAFVRWAKADGRLRDDPMLGVTGYNASEDVRHARRSLSDGEMAALVEATTHGPERLGMSGADRTMAYRLAAGTGFRVNELRSLIPESFKLDGPRPFVALRPEAAKNGRKADQPIPPALASDLRPRLAGKARGRAVLPLHARTAEMIRADLGAAGIAYEIADGFADFPSLRGFYISALIRSGASIETTQTLARHSTPTLTPARYAKLDIHDVTGPSQICPTFLARIPPPRRWPRRERMDASKSSVPFPYPTRGTKRVGFGRKLADRTRRRPGTSTRTNPLFSKISSGFQGVRRKCARLGSNQRPTV